MCPHTTPYIVLVKVSGLKWTFVCLFVFVSDKQGRVLIQCRKACVLRLCQVPLPPLQPLCCLAWSLTAFAFETFLPFLSLYFSLLLIPCTFNMTMWQAILAYYLYLHVLAIPETHVWIWGQFIGKAPSCVFLQRRKLGLWVLIASQRPQSLWAAGTACSFTHKCNHSQKSSSLMSFTLLP